MADVERLTARQERVLAAVLAFRKRRGVPPTYRELGRALGIASTQGVRRHLEALQRKGYLRLRSCARGIEISGGVRGLPILGRIAAGRPIQALENFEGTIDLGEYPEVFAIRVMGDSMIDAGIRDGDLAVVRAGATVENGAIAAVAVGDEATLKRIYVDGHRVRLVPANPKYKEIVLTEGEVRILGRIEGVVRKF